jgi:signal transduction histidine kinase/DNA-binding NarL/FixJ family response regulator
MSEPSATEPRNSGRPSLTALALSPVEQRRLLSSFRLTVKLTGLVVTIVVLLGTMVFLLINSVFDNLTPSIRHDLEWKARHGAAELCGTADLAVVAYDNAGVAKAAQELVHDPDVVAIHVAGERGTVFDHGHVDFNWSTHHASTGQVLQHGALLVASEPVEIEGVNVGRVYVAVSTRRLQAGIELRRTILAAGGLGVALALLAALAFVQLYIGPLLRILADAFTKLETTTLAALESARLKSQFLANMSHEIRTPMHGIMGVTKLALGMPVESKLRHYLEVIDTSARGLLTIINDILDFSKMEAGKYDIHPRPFDLRDVVEESIELFVEPAREKKLELALQVAADVPNELIGDPDRIRQILVNLVSNAVKFTDKGEVEVSVSVAGGQETDKLLLRTSVKDSGCGISPPAQAKLFEAFTQVDGSYARQHGGTGLGLAIVKRLANLMGGETGLHSELGRGSEFWFTVAVEKSHGVPAERRRLDRAQPVEHKRALEQRPVLVVDDNEINRFVAVEQLREFGFVAETACNGAEAVEAVSRRDYAVVLMDCQMPVMDGYAAAREIRRREKGKRRVPIIAVTAHAIVGERDNVLASGMDDYVAKPVRPAALERALLQWAGTADEISEDEHDEAPVLSCPSSDEFEPDTDLTPRLVELFLLHAPEQLGELAKQVTAGNAQSARAQAHKLKGGLYAVGAASLADAMEQLRTLLAAERWDDTKAQLLEIEPRFAGIVLALRTCTQGARTPAADQGDAVQ